MTFAIVSIVGTSLYDLLNYNGEKRSIPLFLKDSVEYILKGDFPSCETLATATKNRKDIKKLTQLYSNPSVSVDLESISKLSVLFFIKEIFLYLPDPLLPENLYEEFRESIQSKKQSTHKIKNIVKRLPNEERNVLQFLIKFFNDIATLSSDVKGTVSVLSNMFGSSIHRKSEMTDEELEDKSHADLLKIMISQYDEIFDGYILDHGSSTDEKSKKKKKEKESKRIRRSGSISISPLSSPSPILTESPNQKISDIPLTKSKEKKSFRLSMFIKKNKNDKQDSVLNKRRGSVSAMLMRSMSIQHDQSKLTKDSILGLPLEKLVENPESPDQYPIILKKCCDYLISSNGYMEPGIFRESGSFDKKIQLINAFSSPTSDPNLSVVDSYTIANVLKTWLRDLPDALLTDHLYQDFKDAIQIEDTDKCIEELIKTLSKLPNLQFRCLKYLMEFLHTISCASEVNKMDAYNLGIVFGPCIHRKKVETSLDIMDPCHTKLATFMIRNFTDIFTPSDINLSKVKKKRRQSHLSKSSKGEKTLKIKLSRERSNDKSLEESIQESENSSKEERNKKSSNSNSILDNIIEYSHEQINQWLIENKFEDLCEGLKNIDGKQLATFSKEDLNSHFKLRGIALYNILHPNHSKKEFVCKKCGELNVL